MDETTQTSLKEHHLTYTYHCVHDQPVLERIRDIVVDLPTSVILLMISMGAVFGLGLHHAVMWVARPKDRLQMWLVVWAITSIAFQIMRCSQVLTQSPEAALGFTRWQLALAAALIITITCWVQELTENDLPPKLFRGLNIIMGLLGAASLYKGVAITNEAVTRVDWLGYQYYGAVAGPGMYMYFIMAVVVFCILARTVLKHPKLDRTGRIVFISALVFYLTMGLSNVLVTIFHLPIPTLFEFAPLSILIAISIMLGRSNQFNYDQLEKAVEERTSALARKNVDLAKAARDAETAAAAKSIFLANMSHEIRTPLNGVLGITELLSDTDLNDEQQDLADTLHCSGKSLLRLLNDVLDFSKIEAGEIVVLVEAVSIHDLINDVTCLFSEAAIVNKVRLAHESDIPPSLHLMVDATRLRQILTNLVSNAIKFSSRGDVTIKTTCEDDELIISVKDTGPGIPPHKLEEIFNVFHQGDDSSTRKYGGTGLGLAISKEFAELLGGTLSVFSSIDASNHGSEFIVSVPASQDARDTQNAIPAANELDENELVTRRQSLNILVAEDNLVNQMLISKLLAKAGYKYQIVSNGAEALHCKNLSEFDAILMDCQMPEMDGYDATREIRAHHASSSELPIIALTANALPGDRERALDSGMDDFLTKPIDRKKLYKTLDHWAFKGSSSTH